MRIFTCEEPSADYTVIIKMPISYNLDIKPVEIGISMKQMALSI